MVNVANIDFTVVHLDKFTTKLLKWDQIYETMENNNLGEKDVVIRSYAIFASPETLSMIKYEIDQHNQNAGNIRATPLWQIMEVLK